MLKLDNIVKDYYVGGQKIEALKGVSLEFRKSEFVSILGPSGCGKTTCLNIIGGLDRYTSGDLVIDGVSTKKYKDRDWDTYRNHRIGFVFQSYNLIPHQSVFRNVELALTLSGVSKKERKERVVDALTKVGLRDQMYKKPNQMSGGQMQRVAIARALVNNPEILLADEPTGALDSVTSVAIMDILKSISNEKLIIMVTHNPELAEQYSSRIVRLKDGLVVDDSNPITEEELEAEKIPEKRDVPLRKKKKSSMSFFTALSLSFNNLLTKKGRTFMTSFAGSIGIIGIALILALSTGVQTYINDIQRETLSSYPITIQTEEMDLSAIAGSLSGKSKSEIEHEENMVYSDSTAYDLFNTFFSDEKTVNNLKPFKEWIDSEMEKPESEEGLSKYATSVHYTYDTSLNIYAAESDGKYRSTDITSAFMSMMGSGSSESSIASLMTSSSSYSSFSLFEEILPGKNGELISDLVKDQYYLVAGSWPTAANEIVLLVSENDEISDLAFYTMGMMSQEELMSLITSAMKQEKIEQTARSISYEDLLNVNLKLVLSANLYSDMDGDGIYTSVTEDDNLLQMAAKNGYDLKISGIIKIDPDATAGALSGTFCYTSALTEYIINETQNTEIVKAFLDEKNANTDIFNGLPYTLDESKTTEEEKIAAIKEYVAGLDNAAKAELYEKIVSTPDEEYIAEQIAKSQNFETRDEMIAFVAESYGIDASVIKLYLGSYSDDELKAMILESTESVIREKYAEEAQAQIDEIKLTPTAKELAAMKLLISSQIKDKESQVGFIVSYWSAVGAMSAESAYAYVSSLSDAQFATILSEVIENAAIASYQQNAGAETDKMNEKLANALDDLMAEASDETLVYYYDNFMPDKVSSSSYDDNLKKIGIIDIESPSSISIYPATFEDKDRIANLITEYNETKEEKDQISYTDYVALLMSGITTIINAVSYVLIAFVSISLIVSSIMIGIITYISVLERTKEIGILRAMGASKKDVSRVFTAETLIIGLVSGLIGILASLLLCIPINIVVHALSGINTINAVLPWAACIILVAISMLLTLVAGLFPSKTAAKKDPVEALRTE